MILCVALAIAGCSHNTQKNTTVAVAQKQAKPCKYICLMDKGICSDKPGICPRCGMKLVAKKN